MMKKKDILSLVHETELPQIRAGQTHRFNNIWIVVVDGRMFCRQYALGGGWYRAFLADPLGAIKIRDTTVRINALVPNDRDEINPLVNEAYIEKYAQRFTREADIARMMTGPQYVETTMELLLVEDE